MMDKRYGAGWIRRAAGLILAAAMLCALTVSALGDDAAEELLIAVQEDITGKAEMTLAEQMIAKLDLRLDDGREITVRRDGRVLGRGKPDDREGSEPYYAGMVGYAVVANDESLMTDGEIASLPWTIPAWEPGDDGWRQTGTIAHKTAVLVLGQRLEKTSERQYDGYIHVQPLNGGPDCWIGVRSFATTPYWLYNPERSAKYGASMAVYQPQSGHLPVTAEGEGTEEPVSGSAVLIPGKDAWNPELADKNNTVPGITMISPDGEGTSEELIFNEDDLALIY